VKIFGDFQPKEWNTGNWSTKRRLLLVNQAAFCYMGAIRISARFYHLLNPLFSGGEAWLF
jgi:hypothetical protein